MNIINIGSLKLISGLKASQFPTALHNCQFNIKYFQLLPLARVSNKKSPLFKNLYILLFHLMGSKVFVIQSQFPMNSDDK